MPLIADNFVIASGSFLSHGLEANPDSVYEPILDSMSWPTPTVRSGATPTL